MPYSYLILCCPLLLLLPIPPSIRVFSNESTLHMRWPKYWSFSFSIIPSKVLLSYKKKCIWVSSNEVDETRTYYIKWSQKNKYCILIYIYIYMELRKTVLAILHARQQRRHRCKEQAFGVSGRRQGWDDLRQQHWNMYITIQKGDGQWKFNAQSRAPKACPLGQPWEGWGGVGMGWGGEELLQGGLKALRTYVTPD